jgi:GntR family transcriptional repressor for pyruvate dehydrogenase complex
VLGALAAQDRPMDKQLREVANDLGHKRAASDIVADAIRRLMAAGRLKPGDRLPPERELASMLGAARVTIRAAVRMLNKEGLLTTARGRSGGTVVNNPGRVAPANSAGAFKKAIAEFYEFRSMIEPMAAQLAAERGSPSQRRALLRLCEDACNSRTSFQDLDSRFHMAIARMTHNPHILEAVERDRGAFVVLVNSILLELDGDDAPAFAREHLRIAQAISSGDGAGAHREMAAHFRRAHQRFINALTHPGGLRRTGTGISTTPKPRKALSSRPG